MTYDQTDNYFKPFLCSNTSPLPGDSTPAPGFCPSTSMPSLPTSNNGSGGGSSSSNFNYSAPLFGNIQNPLYPSATSGPVYSGVNQNSSLAPKNSTASTNLANQLKTSISSQLMIGK